MDSPWTSSHRAGHVWARSGLPNTHGQIRCIPRDDLVAPTYLGGQSRHRHSPSRVFRLRVSATVADPQPLCLWFIRTCIEEVKQWLCFYELRQNLY